MKSKWCADCAAQRSARYGAERLEAKHPGYAGALQAGLKHTEADRILGNYYKGSVAFPSPSRVFPGLSPALDTLLARADRDKNVTLCREIAALKPSEQRDFLDLYLTDPADARHWADLPRWKRPIRKGDKIDQHIWTFFRQYWINTQAHAQGHVVEFKAQGTQLKAMAGSLSYIADVTRLALVLSAFGEMLQQGGDLGDITTKPWERRP